MKRTKEYFEVMRLKADAMAYQLAKDYYEKFLKTDFDGYLSPSTPEEKKRFRSDALHMVGYCQAKNYEASVEFLEKSEIMGDKDNPCF